MVSCDVKRSPFFVSVCDNHHDCMSARIKRGVIFSGLLVSQVYEINE
jgi:hypothetical protein